MKMFTVTTDDGSITMSTGSESPALGIMRIGGRIFIPEDDGWKEDTGYMRAFDTLKGAVDYAKFSAESDIETLECDISDLKKRIQYLDSLTEESFTEGGG